MDKRSNIFVIAIAITLHILLIEAGSVMAQQVSVSYTGSAQYSTGSYFFEEQTQSFSISNGFNISGDKVTLSFNVPFVVQNSPWVSYGIAGYIPTGGPDHKAVQDSSNQRKGHGTGGKGGKSKLLPFKNTVNGYMQMQDGDEVVVTDTVSYNKASFADPNLYANVKLYTSDTGAGTIRLNTALKIPLADPTNGYGTGEWDYGAGVSLSQRLGNFFFIADMMKWWFGDLPDLKLQDPWAYSAGLGLSFAEAKWLINASYSGYTEIIDGFDPPQTLTLGMGHFLSNKASLNGNVSFGLTESSSDLSVGLGWSIQL